MRLRTTIVFTIIALLTVPSAAADQDFAPVNSAESIVLESDTRAVCLAALAEPMVGAPCKVAEFGNLGSVGGHSFAYALYAFRTPDGGSMGARALIFENKAANHLRILFVPEFFGGYYETPKIVRTGVGTLLHIPGTETGTGNFNRERLFVWRGRQWRPVDTTSWLDTLRRRLPKGLGALKGVYPDYRKMRASTPVWRANDSNASPTGGRASMHLALRGDSIVLITLSVRRR